MFYLGNVMKSAFTSSRRELVAQEGNFPAGTWCQNDVVLTSMRHHHVAKTLIRRYCLPHVPTDQPTISKRRFINSSLE